MSIVAEDLLVEVPTTRGRRGVARIGRGMLRQPVTVGAGVVLLVVFLAGLIIPALVPNGSQLHLEGPINHGPTLSGWHLFGTNGLGQDIFLLSMLGLRASAETAVVGTLLATAIGVAVGAFAGYRGGWVDAVLMRIADVLGIPPAILVLLILDFYLQPVSPMRASLIFAGLLWIPIARVMRAELTALRGREFVQAALSLGASDRRIFFRHLLPNSSSPMTVAATAVFGQLILLEATVEFLGLGESEISAIANPTLGWLVGFGKLSGGTFNWGWWVWAGPACVLVVVLVCANLIGDGVAEALRPTARR